MWPLVPLPGIESWPPALGAWSLSHWTTREVCPLNIFCLYEWGTKARGGWIVPSSLVAETIQLRPHCRDRDCMTGTPRCHRAVAQHSYQECCQASACGICLQPDGNLRFNGAAPGAARSPCVGPWLGLLLLPSALLLVLLL